MPDVVAIISLNIHYIIPPILGAFIGYLTNKIAIRMLFRPLKPWYLFGVRIPMTPGVIPSKRHRLAENIGEMVGGHLLTSKEIGKALERDAFQHQLRGLIKDRVGGVLSRDLPSLPEIIPEKYNSYFDIGVKTISYQIKVYFYTFITTQKFEETVVAAIHKGCGEISTRDIDAVINRENRERFYCLINNLIKNLLANESMEQWVEDFIYGEISNILKNNKSLDEILPETLTELIIRSVETKTPDILERLAALIKEPDIQKKLINGIKKAADNFAETLGPMGGMIQNFLNTETIEKVVKDYFNEKEGNIAKWLDDEEVQEKVAQSLVNRVRLYLNTPLVDFVKKSETFNTDSLTKILSKQLISLLRQEGVAIAISSMLRENIEVYLDGGNLQVQTLIDDLSGPDGLLKLKDSVAKEGVFMLRSQKSKELIDRSIDQMINTLLQKPVGKIADFIPTTVREGMYGSIQKISSAMLAVEVPGLVDSLNIRHIISEKVDSLDLLRLERLLLSIMEEQFKYINLFGALLGFIIGGLNVIFLLMI